VSDAVVEYQCEVCAVRGIEQPLVSGGKILGLGYRLTGDEVLAEAIALMLKM
jgi:hypothetical protein